LQGVRRTILNSTSAAVGFGSVFGPGSSHLKVLATTTVSNNYPPYPKRQKMSNSEKIIRIADPDQNPNALPVRTITTPPLDVSPDQADKWIMRTDVYARLSPPANPEKTIPLRRLDGIFDDLKAVRHHEFVKSSNMKDQDFFIATVKLETQPGSLEPVTLYLQKQELGLFKENVDNTEVRFHQVFHQIHIQWDTYKGR